jgi:hypothetical protein
MSPARFAPAFLVAVALAAPGCKPPAPAPARPAPTGPERAALAGPAGAVAIPLVVSIPADGAVVPWPFPSLELQWDDAFAGNAFQVRVNAGQGEPLVDAFTTERRLVLSPDEMARLRTRAGEGGAFEVQVVGASLLPSGRVLRGPTTAVSRTRFSGAGEHPTGSVYYSAQIRPVGAPPGPSDRSHRLLTPRRVTMSGHDERILPGYFDKWVLPDGWDNTTNHPNYMDLGLPEWATRPIENVASRSFDYSVLSNEGGGDIRASLYSDSAGACMGCHVTGSNDGKYVSFMAAMTDRRPGKGGDTFQTLFVVRAKDRELLVQQRYGFFNRFHPRLTNLLSYTLWANEFEDGFFASIYQVDIHVMDLETGRDFAVPGASLPDRCEMASEWSPDGRWMVFSRAPEGEPCDGTRGSLEIARIPWNDGLGGPATVLVAIPPGGGANFQPRYSPDGRWIVFFRSKGGFYAVGSADLWIVPADGGEARRLDVSTDAMDSLHAFSPDGRWLAFQSNRRRVDKVKGYVARFFEDGRVAPAVPLPGAGDPDVAIATLDWVRNP